MKTKHVTDTQVEHIADLARLSLTSVETALYQDQFNAILEYIDQLQEVDTSNVEPNSQVTGLVNVFREDIVTESLPQSVVMSLAPDAQDGYINVHAVFSDNA